jgi:heterotetrameric sarcosine oxidase beta subunit
MRKYSAFAVAREAIRGHKGWPAQWTSPEPRKDYDVIIVGAGGHGLGTAYYLAKEHGITNIAVIEKGWLGGGNTGRNTTIIRSNYLYDESAGLYDHALKLWDGLSQDLNYNVMYSARGVMMLAHNVHDTQVFKRHIHANRLNGIDNEWLTPEQAKEFCPPLNISCSRRAIRLWVLPCSAAAAPPAMMRWPGAMRARRPTWAFILSRTAKSPACAVRRTDQFRVWIPAVVSSAPRRSASWLPGIPL